MIKFWRSGNVNAILPRSFAGRVVLDRRNMLKKLILINTKLTDIYEKVDKKEKRRIDKLYREWVQDLPSALTGIIITGYAHHIRTNNNAGTGKKPADIYMIPLTNAEHDLWHRNGNIWIEDHFIDINETMNRLHDRFILEFNLTDN